MAIHEVLNGKGPERSIFHFQRDFIRRVREHTGTVDMGDQVAALIGDLKIGSRVDSNGIITVKMNHGREEELFREAKRGAASTCDEIFMDDWEGLIAAVQEMREERVALGMANVEWDIV